MSAGTLGDGDFRIRRTDDTRNLRIKKRRNSADLEQRVVARLLIGGFLLCVEPVRHLHDDVGIGEQIFADDLLDLAAVCPDADRYGNPPDGDRGRECSKREERYAPRSEFQCRLPIHGISGLFVQPAETSRRR